MKKQKKKKKGKKERKRKKENKFDPVQRYLNKRLSARLPRVFLASNELASLLLQGDILESPRRPIFVFGCPENGADISRLFGARPDARSFAAARLRKTQRSHK